MSIAAPFTKAYSGTGDSGAFPLAGSTVTSILLLSGGQDCACCHLNEGRAQYAESLTSVSLSVAREDEISATWR